jgi:ATP-dependent Clp protease adaptor protein ClpS
MSSMSLLLEMPAMSDANTSNVPLSTSTQPETDNPKTRPLPMWKVLLHNDDVNSYEYVTATIFQLTPLNWSDAKLRTEEADKAGVALLLTTHQERAELYQDQFTSKGLSVTIEPTA